MLLAYTLNVYILTHNDPLCPQAPGDQTQPYPPPGQPYPPPGQPYPSPGPPGQPYPSPGQAQPQYKEGEQPQEAFEDDGSCYCFGVRCVIL